MTKILDVNFHFANWPLSVFWISNANNAFHNNAAVGGEAGFWAFAHLGKVNF